MKSLPAGVNLAAQTVTQVRTVNLQAIAESLGLPESLAAPQSEEPKRGDGSGQTRRYGNRKVKFDGYTFESEKECKRYKMLRTLENAGGIFELEVQPSYPMMVGDCLICTYRADFRYKLAETRALVVEDVKSEATKEKEVYRLKKKLLWALYRIKVQEV